MANKKPLDIKIIADNPELQSVANHLIDFIAHSMEAPEVLNRVVQEVMEDIVNDVSISIEDNIPNELSEQIRHKMNIKFLGHRIPFFNEDGTVVLVIEFEGKFYYEVNGEPLSKEDLNRVTTYRDIK